MQESHLFQALPGALPQSRWFSHRKGIFDPLVVKRHFSRTEHAQMDWIKQLFIKFLFNLFSQNLPISAT